MIVGGRKGEMKDATGIDLGAVTLQPMSGVTEWLNNFHWPL